MSDFATADDVPLHNAAASLGELQQRLELLTGSANKGKRKRLKHKIKLMEQAEASTHHR